MDVALYILFPEDDDVISLASDKEKLRAIVNSLVAVKKFALQHNLSLKIYYDSENVERFKTDVGSIVDDGAYMGTPMNILRAFVGMTSKDVKNCAVIDASFSYSLWDTMTCMTHPDAPIVIKSAFEATFEPCVLSLGEKIPTDYYQVSIIKDRAYTEYMPKLRSIPLFFAAEECITWLMSFICNDFSLTDKMYFEPTAYRWGKQRIYRKIEDSSYWYFDYFHKDNKIHYEVFGAEGIHLGEAGEDGHLIPDTAKEGRSISKILHGN